MHRIKAPVLVVGGDYDVIDRDHLIATQQAIPGAELKIFPDAGHGLLQDVPSEINQSLREFLLDGDGKPRPCATAEG